MVGQINYGGRVTDNWDRICLLTMLKKCITPDLIASDKYFYSDNESYYCLNCVTL
jgi:dynein heavy chain